MNTLNMNRYAVSLLVKIPARFIEQHSVASPYIVGEEFARQVAAYVHENRMGYYPALDFFRNNEAVEADLISAIESISWLVCGLVREEIRTGLRPVFSHLRFESIQAVAYTMPTVRPGTRNALHDLALHYTPDQIRVNFITTSIRRMDYDPQIALNLVKGQIHRWLKPRFSNMELTSIHYLDENNPPVED